MSGPCLLLLDLMQRLVDQLGDAPRLDAWTRAADAARSAEMPVVYVRVAFRPGYPEVSADNALLAGLAERGALQEADPETAIARELAMQPGDHLVTKRRVSAFAGSDLDVLLRGLDVTTLVLAGLHTSGAVLSTLTDAVDRDHRIVVLSDGCADPDEALHRALIERFFPTRATVTTAAEWATSLAGSRHA